MELVFVDSDRKKFVDCAVNDQGYVFELCVTAPQGIKVATKFGAQRIELCSALSDGGLTPSYGLIAHACDHCDPTNTKVNVLIRPRAGDFIYTVEEIKIMRNDILEAKALGVNGVVFGCLTPNGYIDRDAMHFLMEASEGLEVTFNRAFDLCANREETMEMLIAMGVKRVLSSGGKADALAGAQNLKELNDQAQGRISLIAGAGISRFNIAQIAKITGIKEYHFSAKVLEQSMMNYKNSDVFMGLPGSDEYVIQATGEDKAYETICALLHNGEDGCYL